MTLQCSLLGVETDVQSAYLMNMKLLRTNVNLVTQSLITVTFVLNSVEHKEIGNVMPVLEVFQKLLRMDTLPHVNVTLYNTSKLLTLNLTQLLVNPVFTEFPTATHVKKNSHGITQHINLNTIMSDVPNVEMDTGSMGMEIVFLSPVELGTRTTNVLSAIIEEMESYGKHRKITVWFNAHSPMLSFQAIIVEFSAIMGSISMLRTLNVSHAKMDVRFVLMILHVLIAMRFLNLSMNLLVVQT